MKKPMSVKMVANGVHFIWRPVRPSEITSHAEPKSTGLIKAARARARNSGTLSAGPNSTGVFAHLTAYGVSAVSDGTSNTIMWGEALTGSNTPLGKRTAVGAGPVINDYDPRVVLNGAQVLNTATQTTLAACNTAFNAGTPISDARGAFWAVGSPGYTYFNTILPPNSTQYKWSSCRTDGPAGPDYASFINLNSNHSGGVNVSLCDGSVRFIKDSISQSVYWSLGTKAGGETISADSY